MPDLVEMASMGLLEAAGRPAQRGPYDQRPLENRWRKFAASRPSPGDYEATHGRRQSGPRRRPATPAMILDDRAVRQIAFSFSAPADGHHAADRRRTIRFRSRSKIHLMSEIRACHRGSLFIRRQPCLILATPSYPTPNLRPAGGAGTAISPNFAPRAAGPNSPG